MTPRPDPPASRPQPQSSGPGHAAQWRFDEILILILLVAVAMGIHVQRGPARSRMYPSIMSLQPSLERSEPPSMDELLNLALSTGRGSPFFVHARGELLHNEPAWTSLDGAAPWWRVWTSMSGVTHPPLYMMVLRLWRNVFGQSDVAAIAFSAVCTGVTLIFTALSIRPVAGRAAAFWTGVILAVSPTSSYYALDIRGYSLLTAEAAVAIWLLVRLKREGPTGGNVVGLYVVLLASMLTHYFAAPACLAAGIYAVIVAGRGWPKVVTGGVITAGVYAVVWLPFMLKQIRFIQASGLDYLATDGPQLLYKVNLTLTLPLRLVAEMDGWPAILPTVIGCGVILAAAFWAAVRRPAAWPFVVWFVGVAGGLFVADVWRQTQQLAFIRYPAAAQPAAAAFVPLAVSTLLRNRWAVHAFCGALSLFALVVQPYAIRADAPVFLPTALTFSPRMAHDDVLMLYYQSSNRRSEFVLEGVLLEMSHVPGCFPRDVVLMDDRADAKLLQQLQGRRAWLVSLDSRVDDPTLLVPGAQVRQRVRFVPSPDSKVSTYGFQLDLSAAPLATGMP